MKLNSVYTELKREKKIQSRACIAFSYHRLACWGVVKLVGMYLLGGADEVIGRPEGLWLVGKKNEAQKVQRRRGHAQGRLCA